MPWKWEGKSFDFSVVHLCVCFFCIHNVLHASLNMSRIVSPPSINSYFRVCPIWDPLFNFERRHHGPNESSFRFGFHAGMHSSKLSSKDYHVARAYAPCGLESVTLYAL